MVKKAKRKNKAIVTCADVGKSEGRRKAEDTTGMLIAILQTIPLRRSRQDKLFTFGQLRLLEVFNKLSDSVLFQLAGVIMVKIIDEPNHVVFSQGDTGTTWYVVLNGHLNVSVDFELVNSISPGQGFGELALLGGDGKRHATVITKTKAILLCIDKIDYNRIIKHEHKRDRHEKRLMIRSSQHLILKEGTRN